MSSRDWRRLVAQVWAARAASEKQAGAVLGIVADDLRALGASESLVRLARAAVAQEDHHAALCREVALAYHPDVEVLHRPMVSDTHDGEDSATIRCRHVIGFCCISETFATAFLNDCRGRASHSLARRALRILLSDEVGHGRLGWAFLASAAAPRPERVTGWLVPLLRSYRDHLRGRAAALPSVDLAEHGCPHPSGMLPLYRAALHDLILPGFDHVGVSTVAARQWVSDGRNWVPDVKNQPPTQEGQVTRSAFEAHNTRTPGSGRI